MELTDHPWYLKILPDDRVTFLVNVAEYVKVYNSQPDLSWLINTNNRSSSFLNVLSNRSGDHFEPPRAAISPESSKGLLLVISLSKGTLVLSRSLVLCY